MSEADVRRLPRLVPMALAAAREAAAGLVGSGDASIDVERSRKIGVVLGTGAGGIDFTLDQADVAYGPSAGPARQPSLWTITNATHGNLAGELSIRLGLRGPSWCMSTGCASSSDAIGMAMETLRSDRPGAPEAMVVIGADAHVRWETLLGMELLKVISTRRCETAEQAAAVSRPFDAGRDGFILAEGAWAVVLEREALARERGARVLGEAMGYGATCDAFHRVRPEPDMAESARAMRMAVEDAGLSHRDVELIHYHGTSTQVNDEAETRAVKLAFGDHAPRLRGTSVKSMIGHPQGACGAAAVVATLGALAGLDGGAPFVPPTINLRERDPACDLEYTASAAAAARGDEVALVNCLAFGAKNSALVVRGA